MPLCSEGAIRVYCPERKVVRYGKLTSLNRREVSTLKITDNMIKRSCSATIYKRGMEYYELNDMDKNKDYTIGKIEKIDDPNFLGYLINIASVSYITQL